MNISQAFKALGNQHLEEQNILGKGLSMGVSTVKDYFEDKKLKKEAGMKAMQAELLSKKLESNLSPKVQKQPQMKI